ncbi:MAG: DUF2075 domain-containing protein [Opitutaceae bacterium]
MIVYLSDKRGFRDDVMTNRIEEIIHEAYRKQQRQGVSHSEILSWRNSLGFMDRILGDQEIPDNAGVAVEFIVPSSAKRIDVTVTGTNAKKQKTAVIIELKQWTEVDVTLKDGVVATFIGRSKHELPHPSYQAWSYAVLLEDYSEVVRKSSIQLRPCAYLHNCDQDHTVRDTRYREYLQKAPAFLKDDAVKLRAFIRDHVRFGDRGDIIYEINSGVIRPSKDLADSLVSLLNGNKEFVLIDDQKLVYETALSLAQNVADGRKQTLIVEGGPGTGKSVVAVNLLVELTHREKLVKYVTKNAAPRAVYECKLKGNGRKSRISNLFTGSGSYVYCKSNEFDVLVVDEAHRLNEKSGMFANQGENQIKELIQASKLSVFFIDDAQRVTMRDIGSIDAIRDWAKRCGAEITEMKLESQFRCNGSDGYLAWVDQLLGIRQTANQTLDGIPYEFTVCDSACELRELIRQKNHPRNKARMVAGYCWNWISKDDRKGVDISLDGGAFQAQWNFNDASMPWLLQLNSVEQVGCIHTCQGLDLEYIGVIFGPDLVIRNGQWVEFPNRRAKTDASIKGYKKLMLLDANAARKKIVEIIRNTYRTLMTRAQKGCFLYSVDPETNAFIKQAAGRSDYPILQDGDRRCAAEDH